MGVRAAGLPATLVLGLVVAVTPVTQSGADSPIGVLATGASDLGPAATTSVASLRQAGRLATTAASKQAYINYAAPAVPADALGSELVSTATMAESAAYDRKLAGGNPVAATQLALREQVAMQTGVSPRDQLPPPADGAFKARLLTVLVEFDETAEDDFSGVWVPRTVFGSRTCIQLPDGTHRSGPLHNRIQDPAHWEPKDNQTFWLSDFDREHYSKMLFSREGITERVRLDLTGPDGEPGFDITGYTLRKLYKHMSEDSYIIRGQVTPWLEVDHSEAWYGASRCFLRDDGQWVAGSNQSNNGHPDNPLGVRQLAIDAIDLLAETQPDFPFADYDQEDPGDLDGDGDFREPDGTIDHVALVHAGQDKSAPFQAQGTDAIWAHSSSIVGGHEIPGAGGLRLSNYIVMPENGGAGIFAHEYGHDLGLHDLYDTAGGGADVEFWDLMAVGSHTGPLWQTMPTYIGLWGRWVLGWAEPETFAPGSEGGAVDIGESPYRPSGTEDGVIVNLPPKPVVLAEPHSGQHMWWSQKDQVWAKNSLTRTVKVPSGADVRFWMWNDIATELNWDFGFVELSTDGGSTWSQPRLYAEDGAEVTTPDDYADPNGMLAYFGKERGLTGSSGGWRHDYLDLTPYAGTSVQVRLSYATDSGTMDRGWFADDFAVTVDGTPVWTDDVESGPNGWTSLTDTWVPGTPLGAGWTITDGITLQSHYYLAEWRSFHGFDRGLRYSYDTTYSAYGPWQVERVKQNARGMLVWYRDTTYGTHNHTIATTYHLPSTGSKGGLLLVDSHFDPLRRQGEAAVRDASVLDNLGNRPQSSNAAFGLHPTFKFTECLAEVAGEDPFTKFCTSFGRDEGVATFRDDQTWYPGIEVRGDPGAEVFYLRDVDASVVIPNTDNEQYSTRVVDQEGNPLPDWYGVDIGIGSLLGDGSPTRPYGVRLTLISVDENNRFATVMVTPAG